MTGQPIVHLVALNVGYVPPDEGVSLSCGCGWHAFVPDSAPTSESSVALAAAVTHQMTAPAHSLGDGYDDDIGRILLERRRAERSLEAEE